MSAEPRQAGAWLADLVQQAYTSAPAARRLLDRAGVRPDIIRTSDDLQRLPITRRDDLIQQQREQPPFGGWLAVEPASLKRIFQSPGPLNVPQGQKQDYWRFGPALAAAGMCAGDVVICSVSFHLTPLGHIFDDALAALGAVVLPGGVGNTELQLGWIQSLGATGYVGTPSFLNILLDRAEEQGLRPSQGLPLRNAFVTAEMLPESLRQAIQARGVQVRQGYGTADLGLLGYECETATGMHVPDSALLEIVDPATGQVVEPGQPGEVVATVDNPAYPLLRIGTGDLSQLVDEPCGCGRPGARLTRILGRIGDAVKVRGMFVHPRQVEELLQRFPEVRAAQLVVTRAQHRDDLTVRLECPDRSEAFEAGFLGALRDVLKLRAELEWAEPGSLAADAKRIDDRRVWD
jgi:phenylacetate-CoA ligase